MYGCSKKITELARWFMYHPADMGPCKLGRRPGTSSHWKPTCLEFFRDTNKFLLPDALRKENRKRKALSRPTKQRTQTG